MQTHNTKQAHKKHCMHFNETGNKINIKHYLTSVTAILQDLST